MHEVGVDGAADDLTADLFEFSRFIVELANLCGAHEREIEWPEEKNHILSFELLEADLLEFLFPPRHGFKGWSWLADDCFVLLCCFH